MYKLTEYLLSRGLSADTVFFAVLTLMLLTTISFFRQIVGIKGFGVFSSLSLCIALVLLGVKNGTALFVSLLLASYVLRKAFKNLEVLHAAKNSIILGIIAPISLFVIIAIDNDFFTIPYLFGPVLLMLSPIERFLSSQTERGEKKSFVLALESILISATISAPISTNTQKISEFILKNSIAVIIVSLILSVLIAKYAGLRAIEIWRFRKLKNA